MLIFFDAKGIAQNHLTLLHQVLANDEDDVKEAAIQVLPDSPQFANRS